MAKPMTASEARKATSALFFADIPSDATDHIAATLRAYADMLDQRVAPDASLTSITVEAIILEAFDRAKAHPEAAHCAVMRAADAILALLPTPKAKALVWEESAPDEEWSATTQYGNYVIHKVNLLSPSPSYGIFAPGTSHMIVTDHPTLEAAQAAAQDHYQAALEAMMEDK